MPWTFEQQVRLQHEKQIISKYLKVFNPVWINPTIPGEAYIEMIVTTSVLRRQYRLALMLPSDLPNSVPQIYITSPKPLKNYSNIDMVSLGASSVMHTLNPSTNGFVQICHYKPTHWTPNITLYKVFMKAILWLNAYENHLQYGLNMDVYLPHQ